MFENIGSVFPSSAAAIGFGITILIWFLSEIVGGRILPALRRGGSKVERRNVGSNTLLWICWIIIFAVSFGFAGKSIALLPSWTYYIGIVAMISGIVLRQWSIAVLGRYFSTVIGIQKNQTVVDRGPYRFVRHPSYTGVLLIVVGLGLAVQSWGAVVVAVVLFGVAYGHRMLLEEKVLISALGDSYLQYMKRTKRIIPFAV